MASVDVVVPCYQYGRFLRACVTSVLTQRCGDLRVLIIDNASTDDSVEVARQLALEDSRVEVVARRRNLGPHASYNEGIEWARADYFMILCADDMLAPGSFARSIPVMDRHPGLAFAYGRAVPAPPDGAPPALRWKDLEADWRIVDGRTLLKRFCRTAVCPIAECSALVRTSMQKAAGYYRAALPHTDDFEIWMRLALLGGAAETDAVQGILRMHPASRSATAQRTQLLDIANCAAAFDSFFANEGRHAPGVAGLRRVADRGLAARAYWSALSHICRGQGGAGLDLLRYAFTRSPSAAILPPVDYVFRREDAFRRIGGILSGAVR